MVIHKWVKRNDMDYYLCNQAVCPTRSKLSWRWDKVTCKNCLKQRPDTYQPDKHTKKVIRISTTAKPKGQDIQINFIKNNNSKDSIFTSDTPIEIGTEFDKQMFNREIKSILKELKRREFNEAKWYKKIYLYIKDQFRILLQ